MHFAVVFQLFRSAESNPPHPQLQPNSGKLEFKYGLYFHALKMSASSVQQATSASNSGSQVDLSGRERYVMKKSYSIEVREFTCHPNCSSVANPRPATAELMNSLRGLGATMESKEFFPCSALNQMDYVHNSSGWNRPIAESL